jgi:hypothetical protein
MLGEPERETLADALKSLKQGVSRRMIGEAEHFWQKRYYDFNVRNEAQFAEKLRYIHRNPVKAGAGCGRGRLRLWNYPTQAKRRLEWGTPPADNGPRRSPRPILCENVVPFLHDRVARVAALGVVPLRWLVFQVPGVNVLDAASYSNAP